MKYNASFRKVKFWLANFVSLMLFSSIEVWAQMPSIQVPAKEEPDTPDDYTWWYGMLFLLAIGLIGTILWRMNNKKASKLSKVDKAKTSKKSGVEKNGRDSFSIDQELEWYRKNFKTMNARANGNPAQTNGEHLPLNSLPSNRNGAGANDKTLNENDKPLHDLPVFSIQKVQTARPFAPLPISNDEALMSAIEQTYEEFEEDEEIRELSVKILAAFKTRNSVEALSEVALYDLSSNLRSKAVTILSEFDHESVFETILLACADPTREVKAAAARALFRLSFDRANAWTRIADSDEEGRMRQIARAAIEADLVDRTLERLAHEDHKIAQEAAAFTVLMIKSGETTEIFNAVVKNKKMNVRKAILHIIKITKNQKALEGLYTLLEKNSLPLELQEEVDKTIEEIGFVTV